MSTSLSDAIKSAADAFVQAEVTRVLPNVAHLVPGLPGVLLSAALSEPGVQAGLAELETKAVGFAVDEAAKGFSALTAMLASHIHGKLGQVLQAELQKAVPPLPLSPQDAANIGVLVAAGKLSEALKAAIAGLGLVPA